MGHFFLNREKIYIQYFEILAGTLLMAMAVVMYFNPMAVVSGGATGVAVILNNIFDTPMWVVSALINVPLFVLGRRTLDRQVFVRTLAATAALTVFLGIIPETDILTGDKLVDIIIGSVLMGTGLGLIFVQYASSGGSDLLATIINVKIKYLSIPKIMAFIDGLVVVAGTGTFGISNGIYSLIAIYVIARVSDTIVEGLDKAKLMYIVTGSEDKISDYIMRDMERGVTYIQIQGAYTGECRNMIMCVVSGKEMVKIKQKVYQMDESAMCFVGDIREAFGEGFTKFRG